MTTIYATKDLTDNTGDTGLFVAKGTPMTYLGRMDDLTEAQLPTGEIILLEPDEYTLTPVSGAK